MSKIDYKNDFFKGVLKENLVFIVLLGLCPALGVTAKVSSAFGMGGGVLFVLLGSNIVISLLKNVIPDKVRIPVYIVIIATFVTVVDMFMSAYTWEIYKTMKLFIPLIVVNCIVLGRAEAFASKNTVLSSILDALGMGIGFFIAILSIALVREILGSGQISLPGLAEPISLGFPGAKMLALPPGALIVMGILKVGYDMTNKFLYSPSKKKKNKKEVVA